MKEFTEDPLDVLFRLAELERLEDGWLDGEGRALDKRGIRWFAEMFERFFPYDLPLPYVYPTVEGNIRLEWTFGTCELSLEVDLKNHRGEWLAVDVETDEEECYEVNLDKVEDWEKVCSRLLNRTRLWGHYRNQRDLINTHSVDDGS